MKTRNWNAWVNLMPPGPPVLHVMGEVLVGTPGHKAVLTINEPQGINERILLLTLNVIPYEGVVAQVESWVVARFESVVSRKQYSQVQITGERDFSLTIDIQEAH